MEKVAVQLGQRSYPIVIAPDLLTSAQQVPELSVEAVRALRTGAGL